MLKGQKEEKDPYLRMGVSSLIARMRPNIQFVMLNVGCTEGVRDDLCDHERMVACGLRSRALANSGTVAIPWYSDNHYNNLLAKSHTTL